MKKLGITLSALTLLVFSSCGGWSDEDRTSSINSCVTKYKAMFELLGLEDSDSYEDVYLDACKCTQEKIEEKYDSPSSFREDGKSDHQKWVEECFDLDAFMKEATGMDLDIE